jgi:hypothetical protein
MTVAAVTAAALMLAIGAAPLFVFGADHLDAPGLSSPETRSDADINDLYVFEGSNASKTVIAVSTHPAAGAIAPLKYAPDIKYVVNVDTDGDAIQDIAYVWRFRSGSGARQPVSLKRYEGTGAKSLTGGASIVSFRDGVKTGDVRTAAKHKVFAGLRSDPFFFDLDAFLNDVLGAGGDRHFCDQDGGTAGIDFFEALNVNAVVLEVPDGLLGQNIGVWATTIGGDGQIDRMGRPAINTVINSGADKNAFNAGRPRDDRAVFGDNARAVLSTFSALDVEGVYAAEALDTLVSVLLPDLLTYDTATTAAGPLNGRALADDVIDAELNIVTGGFPFAGRDAVGAITGDCVGAHSDLLSTFPYLGQPH